MKQEELQKAITRIDEDIANLKKEVDKEVDSLQEQRLKLCNQYIEEHALIPAGNFAKATWLRNGKKHSGVVFVTANNLYNDEKGGYKVLPTLLKCEPYKEKDDDGTGKHYYSDYWEKQRKFIAYDELISIEPYDAPRQTCGKCLFLEGKIKDGKLHTYCAINIGRKCEGGSAYACDRFKWWNWEQSMGCTHIEYMRKKVAEDNSDKLYQQ